MSSCPFDCCPQGDPCGYCTDPPALKLRRTSPRKECHCTTRQVRKFCKVDGPAEGILKAAMDKFGLSARAYTKILKTARTIADLDGAEEIRTEHVSEAIQYRGLDRNLWA